MITTALSMEGFRAAVSENGEKGFEMFAVMRGEICLVLADVMMPGGNGVEMADRIRELDANVPIVLISGYSDHDLVREGQERYPMLRKPFLPTDLLRQIRSHIDAASLGR